MTGNVSLNIINNTASSDGGALCSNRSAIIIINASKFNNNLADGLGGLLWSFKSNVTTEASEFQDPSTALSQ